MVVDFEEKGSSRIITLDIQVEVWYDGGTIPARPPDELNEYHKDLTPTEVVWSLGYCRVTTELAVIVEENGEVYTIIFPVTIEWNTAPPTMKDKWSETGSGKRVTVKEVARDAIVTLTTVTGPFYDEDVSYPGLGSIRKTTTVTEYI